MDDLLTLASGSLGTRWAGKPLRIVGETGSTNDDARAAAQSSVPHGFTVVADTQSAGRGRRGRAWHSPAGENLYLSVVLRVPLAPADATILTFASGLAVADALDAFVEPVRVTLKWPNDVRIDRRKVAGVLVEGTLRGAELAFAVAGIGINVNGESLPDELLPIATSLRRATANVVSRAMVLERVLFALERRVDELLTHGPAATLEAVRRRCDTIGTNVRVDGVAGLAAGIGPDGALRIETATGMRDVRFGEVIESG